MKKRKVTFVLDEKLARDFIVFVAKKHERGRKSSEEANIALREYLDRHKPRGKA